MKNDKQFEDVLFGYILAKGSFEIELREQTRTFRLSFNITENKRDAVFLNRVKEFMECGSIHNKPNNTIVFWISKNDELLNVIKIMNMHEIYKHGVKLRYYAWKEIYEIYNNSVFGIKDNYGSARTIKERLYNELGIQKKRKYNASGVL